MPGVLEPRTGLSMGEHCEQMAQDLEDLARAIRMRSRISAT